MDSLNTNSTCFAKNDRKLESFVFESSVSMLTLLQLKLIFRYFSSIKFGISLNTKFLKAPCFNLIVVLEETSPNEDLSFVEHEFVNLLIIRLLLKIIIF